LERLADVSREYEVPYVLGESEDAAAGFTAEAATESATLLLIRAPFSEGVTFPDARVTLFGNADLFDVTPSVERPSRKIRTSGFFSDFAELKPGDFVVHVDHGIGQFDGLRQIESDGRRGEFMLLKYADEARISWAGRRGTRARRALANRWKTWPTNCWRCTRSGRRRRDLRFHRREIFSENLRTHLNLKKRRIKTPRSRILKEIWSVRHRWTGCCAATWGMAKPK